MKIDLLKVKLLMVTRQWNQKKLSEEAKIRESTLSNIMRGKSKGRTGTWLKIAQVLEVDVAEILAKEKEQTH